MEDKDQKKLNDFMEDSDKYFDVFQTYLKEIADKITPKKDFGKFAKEIYDYFFQVTDYLHDLRDYAKTANQNNEKLTKQIKEIKFDPTVIFPEQLDIKEPKWFKWPDLFKVNVENKKPIEVKITNVKDFPVGGSSGRGPLYGTGGSSGKVANPGGDYVYPATSDLQDRLALYKAADTDETDATTAYYGFVKPSGAWYVLALTKTGTVQSLRYSTGASDYVTNWTNKSSLTYDYLFNVTIY